MEKYVNVKEAAELLDYTPANITHLLRTGKLNGVKRGRAWLIKKEDLHSLIQDGNEGKTFFE